MDSSLTGIPETESPSSYSVDFAKTLDGSDPNSNHSKTLDAQTLDGSESNSDHEQTLENLPPLSPVHVKSCSYNTSALHSLLASGEQNLDSQSDVARFDVFYFGKEREEVQQQRSFDLLDSGEKTLDNLSDAAGFDFRQGRREKGQRSYDFLDSGEQTLDDQSDTTRLDVFDFREEREEQQRRYDSPVRTLCNYSAMGWSQPWPLFRDRETRAPHWRQQRESENRNLTLGFPSMLDEFKRPMVGAGLKNLGNTCFLNAVLQCFTHTVPLVQGLRSSNHRVPCDRDSEGFCPICALGGHIELSLASMGRIVYPFKFVDNLSYFSSSFNRFQQEDAHEFLQCFLDRLDSCYDLSSEDNFVKQIFGGHLISKLRCCNCGHSSDTYEPLIDLSLEIEDVDTLSSALESFTKVEKIGDAETKFTCEHCKIEVSVKKQLMLDHAPSVATLHLKRFKNYGSYVEKIDKHVEFPLELDLRPYTNGYQNSHNVDLNYDLYAVVVHVDLSSTLAHYYCYIRSAPHTWHRLDDSKVIRVRQDYVLSEAAYILFYAKQGTPWFSSLVEKKMPCLVPNISNASPKSVLDSSENNRILSQSPTNSQICELNKTRVVSDGVSTESSYRSNSGFEFNTATDDSPSISDKIFTPDPLGESNWYQKSSEVKSDANVNITSQTHPRSSTPNIYMVQGPGAEVSEVSDSLSCHLLQKKSCKRPLNKDSKDTKKKKACKVLKTRPRSSGSGSFSAMIKVAQNKKRKRKRKLSRKKDYPHKPKLSLRPVAVGKFF